MIGPSAPQFRAVSTRTADPGHVRCVTLAHDGRRFEWLPDEGVVLTKADLERIFVALRALISGTAQLEPNRAHAVDIAVTITRALERNYGDD